MANFDLSIGDFKSLNDVCPKCGVTLPVRRSGRKKLDIGVKNICDVLRVCRDITLAAEKLGCSRAYIPTTGKAWDEAQGGRAGEMIKASIYVRVSTGDQAVANQVLALTEWARKRGCEVVAIYSEEESAWKTEHSKGVG